MRELRCNVVATGERHVEVPYACGVLILDLPVHAPPEPSLRSGRRDA
ncbi:MAG: hypothetical protein Q7T55_14050 [Solirubrobacteraceae bacterium]|nr:hypothetical protein [Solirubrobacteraceae bacterium]